MTTFDASHAQPDDADTPGEGVLPLIAERRSPAVFDPTRDVTDAELTTIFDAARWAPSAGNSQPYRYVVGRRGERGGDETFEAIVSTLTRGNRRWAPAASVLAVSFVQTSTLPGATKDFVFAATAAHDLGQATAYLTLQAHSMGLAVHQFSGFDHEEAARLLSPGPEWAIMAGLAIGRAWPEAERDAEHAAVQRIRRDVAEFDLAGNVEREAKPRRRRPHAEVASWRATQEWASQSPLRVGTVRRWRDSARRSGRAAAHTSFITPYPAAPGASSGPPARLHLFSFSGAIP